MNKRKISLTFKILIALILGVIFGILGNVFFEKSLIDVLIKWILNPIGQVFLRGITMLVVPLVLFSLISGTASVGDVKKVGRIGIKIFGYYLCTTAFAITIALLFANLFKPGLGSTSIPTGKAVATAKPPFIMDIFVNMIPKNPISAMVEGNMLQIITFAIIFGIALTLVGKSAKPLLDVINQTNSVLLKMIGIVMKIAPLGVFGLISSVVLKQGLDALVPLIKYVGLAVAVMAFQAIFVYGGMLTIFTKLSPITFFKKFWPAMVVALSTSSSNATIPVNTETCNNKLGVSKSVSSFTIPLGATINMDGTAIMQGVAVLFIAQRFGIQLGFESQIMIILVATLASIGTAGVPSAGVIMLTMVLQQVGLPLEGVALVLSVDRIVDMARTTVNITGDAVGTIIVANSEGELDREKFMK